MTSQRLISQPLISAAFVRSACAALLIAGVLGSAPVHAQEAIESFLGALGLKPSDEDNKYPERAPLVVPPTTKLPKPKSISSVNDPAWPKDPEILKKKAAEAEAATFSAPPEASKALTLEEMKALKNAGPRTNTPSIAVDTARPLSVQEMSQADEIMKKIVAEKSSVSSDGKSVRNTLSDPPLAVKKKAVITPEIEAATKAATGDGKAWYQFW